MTLGMASGKYNEICVQDIGLTGKTIADGLAVGRPSGFVCERMRPMMAGAFTVTDEHLLEYQKVMKEQEEIFLEPSACAGFKGAADITRGGNDWETYIREHHLEDKMENAIHLVWATGGGLMEKLGEN